MGVPLKAVTVESLMPRVLSYPITASHASTDDSTTTCAQRAGLGDERRAGDRRACLQPGGCPAGAAARRAASSSLPVLQLSLNASASAQCCSFCPPAHLAGSSPQSTSRSSAARARRPRCRTPASARGLQPAEGCNPVTDQLAEHQRGPQNTRGPTKHPAAAAPEQTVKTRPPHTRYAGLRSFR